MYTLESYDYIPIHVFIYIHVYVHVRTRIQSQIPFGTYMLTYIHLHRDQALTRRPYPPGINLRNSYIIHAYINVRIDVYVYIETSIRETLTRIFPRGFRKPGFFRMYTYMYICMYTHIYTPTLHIYISTAFSGDQRAHICVHICISVYLHAHMSHSFYIYTHVYHHIYLHISVSLCA